MVAFFSAPSLFSSVPYRNCLLQVAFSSPLAFRYSVHCFPFLFFSRILYLKLSFSPRLVRILSLFLLSPRIVLAIFDNCLIFLFQRAPLPRFMIPSDHYFHPAWRGDRRKKGKKSHTLAWRRGRPKSGNEFLSNLTSQFKLSLSPDLFASVSSFLIAPRFSILICHDIRAKEQKNNQSDFGMAPRKPRTGRSVHRPFSPRSRASVPLLATFSIRILSLDFAF